jgi:hypothetical protein
MREAAMDLEQFVSESLAQIIRGVEAARDTASGVGATINPPFTPYDTGAVMGKTDDRPTRVVLAVNFDVAVLVGQNIEGKGGVSITVPILSAKVGGGATSSTEATSRVKFKVPIALPHDAASLDAYEKRVAEGEAKQRRAPPLSMG